MSEADAAGGLSVTPFLSPLTVDWLRNFPDERYRRVPGTLVFADISGFTRLTERLASRGRVGAEEISDLLDQTLGGLLDVAYAEGGWLVKWGGDALLLMYEDEGHARRACTAALRMQQLIAERGGLDTSVGRVRLRLSVGVHSGQFDFFLVGDRHKELIISGDEASATAELEAVAVAGEVLVSAATADELPPSWRGPTKGDGILLARVRLPERRARRAGAPEPFSGVELGLPELVRRHILAGGGSGEHRQVAVAFIEFRGVNRVRAAGGPAAVAAAIGHVVDVTQRACAQYSVSFHETDINADGGKIMLVAGAPMSLDNPEEAILCTARQVADDPGGLAIRVGITSGRAFTGCVGPPYRRSYSVKGDVVNLAARLMGKAQPGEVRAIPAVITRSLTRFETLQLEPFAVKGKHRPITAVSVGAARTRLSEDTELPLVGRDLELAGLTAALAAAREGVGQVLDVVAEPGMGKSRLLGEYCRRTPIRVVSSSGEPFRTSTPYGLVQRVLVEALGLTENVPKAWPVELEAWARANAPGLQPYLPLLAAALGVHLPETAEVRGLREQFRKRKLEDCVIDALRTATGGPLLLLLDDVQFADDASTGLLARMAERMDHLPWVVVIARRPNVRTPWAGQVTTRSIELSALDEAAARELVQNEAAQAPLAPHALAAVVARGGGNPLFLRELARAAQGSVALGELPETVERVMALEIDGLPPAERSLLRAASVLGMHIDLLLLGELLSDEVAVDDEMLSRLSGLLKREGTGWLFRQALVRDTAYEGLPYRQRARLHGKLADLLAADGHQLDSAALSLHYFEAGRYGEAMRHAEAAATSAKDAYACFDAAFLLERALAAARRLSDVATEQHAALQEQLGDVRHRLGEFSRADVNFTAASRLRRDDPVGRARVTVAAARSAERRGEYGLALRRLARAWRTLSGEPDEERVEQLRARIRLQTGWLRFHQEKPAEAKAACQPLVESADPPPPEVLASALQLTDLAELAMGESQGGRLERAMSLYGQLGDLWAQANLYGQLGYRAYFEGRWPEALRHYQRSQELCERAGDTWYASVQTGNIAEILLDQGKLTEAESALRQALPVWRASGAGEQIAFGTALLGRAQCRRGHFEEGRALLNRALEQYRKDGSVGDARDVEAYLAESFMLEGRLDEALTAARALLAATESSARAPLLHRIIGRCLEAQGDSTAALASYQKGLQLARQRGAQHEVAFLLTALGASGTGQRQPLEEARQLYAELGVVVDLTVPAPRRRTPAQIAPSG